MKRALLIALFLTLASFAPQEAMRPDEMVKKSAEGQLETFLDKVQPGEQPKYGFAETDDLDLCTVGKPFRIIEFSKEFFAGHQISETTDYISVKNEWRVPVIANGKYRTMLAVSGTSGNYAVTGMADPEIARELQAITAHLSDKDTWYILRIYPAMVEFFVHENDNSFINAQFIPLASARQAMPELIRAAKPYYTLTETEHMVWDAFVSKR